MAASLVVQQSGLFLHSELATGQWPCQPLAARPSWECFSQVSHYNLQCGAGEVLSVWQSNVF